MLPALERVRQGGDAFQESPAVLPIFGHQRRQPQFAIGVPRGGKVLERRPAIGILDFEGV